MYINPRYAIEQGWITGIKDEGTQIQPNAIDFTVDQIHIIDHMSPFFISNDKNDLVMRKRHKIDPTDLALTRYHAYTGKNADITKIGWTLESSKYYDIQSDIYVEVPEGVCVQLVIRSSFNRNGVYITSGLYDSGFKGHIGCVLYNAGGWTDIVKSTRIGQIIFIKSENSGLYSGGYNHEKNTHWTKAITAPEPTSAPIIEPAIEAITELQTQAAEIETTEIVDNKRKKK